MNLLCNAFSLSMLPGFFIAGRKWTVAIEHVPESSAVAALQRGFESFVGHPETARVLSSILGVEVKCHRVSFDVAAGDTLWVAQYSGSRLPEGATTLPPGATFVWMKIQCLDPASRTKNISPK